MVHQLLRAANGKGRDDDRPAARNRLLDDPLKLCRDRLGIMTPVAVGGLDDDIVGISERCRIREDRRAIPSQISREDQSPAAFAVRGLPPDDGRPEDMTGPLERYLNPTPPFPRA